MFEREVAVNRWQLKHFEQIVADLNQATLYQSSPGHGHAPVWILGHLIITGELGQRMLGGSVTHREWLALFGPGSSDQLEDAGVFQLHDLSSLLLETYGTLQQLALNVADEAALDAPHQIPLFEHSPLTTTADVVTLLLTSHFSFHLAQLSSTRRSQGHSLLF